MPVKLNDDEKLSVPPREIPATEAAQSWLGLVVLTVPKSGPWSAVTEGHPIDAAGNVYYRHPITGEDTTLRIESPDLMADAQRSSVLAVAINQVMAGIITATTEIKKLREEDARA